MKFNTYDEVCDKVVLKNENENLLLDSDESNKFLSQVDELASTFIFDNNLNEYRIHLSKLIQFWMEV